MSRINAHHHVNIRFVRYISLLTFALVCTEGEVYVTTLSRFFVLRIAKNRGA